MSEQPDLAGLAGLLRGRDQALAWARAERASLLACLDHAVATDQPARVIALTTGLAGLLRGGAVPLMQASTPTEARLIRERIAAAGGAAAPLVSLGPPGDLDAELPAEVTGRGDDTTLVPVRVAWLPEEHAGRRAARLADLVPGRDPYRPGERQQRRILARQPGRAKVVVGEPATIGSLRRSWTEAAAGYARARPGRVPAARTAVQDAQPGQGGDPGLAPVPRRTAGGAARPGR